MGLVPRLDSGLSSFAALFSKLPVKSQFFMCNVILWLAFCCLYFFLVGSETPPRGDGRDEGETTPPPHFANLPRNVGDVGYFALTTQFTVGYGDVTPLSSTAKAVTCLHMVLSFYLNVLEMMYPNRNVWSYPTRTRAQVVPYAEVDRDQRL